MPSRQQLGELKVADIQHLVVEEPSTIGPDAPVDELLVCMLQDLRTRNVYVVDENRRLLGCVPVAKVVDRLFPLEAIVSQSFEAALRDASALNAKTVGDLMVSSVPAVNEDTTLGDVAKALMKGKVQELAVVDPDGCLVGEVNVYEIIKAYLEA
jgi:CBS-domain-containing membrane protein